MQYIVYGFKYMLSMASSMFDKFSGIRAMFFRLVMLYKYM